MNNITYSFPSLSCKKHKIESTASSFKLSLRSSGSCLRLRHHLLFPTTVPSITWFRRHFLCKMWPIHIPSFRTIVRMIFLSTLSRLNTSYFLNSLSKGYSPSFSNTAFQKCQMFLIHVQNQKFIFLVQTPRFVSGTNWICKHNGG